MADIVLHTLKPVFDSNSEILMLGTMPSPKSRELQFYYGHPQNRFWRVVSAVCSDKLPTTNEEKTAFLQKHHIALWDVLASCEIEKASDASIKKPVPNDLSLIFHTAKIKAVFTTGTKAFSLYNRFFAARGEEYPKPHLLSSTSPANCRLSEQALIDEYSVITHYLNNDYLKNGGTL